MRNIMLVAFSATVSACAEGTGEIYMDDDTDDTAAQYDGGAEEDLTGGYATCEEAMVGLGFQPWTDYMEWETTDHFEVQVDQEGEANNRPWIATLTFVQEEPGYRLTCGDSYRGEADMWVDKAQPEYRVCAFTGVSLAIMDPESDPGCSEGLSEAYRSDGQDAYEYERVAPGLFVAKE